MLSNGDSEAPLNNQQLAAVKLTPDQTTYRFADILPAVWTPDRRLDDLVGKDHHVHISDRVKSKTDTQEVENCLGK